MPDDLTRRQPEDPKRINTSEAWEVNYWSKLFNVTPEQLKQAVKEVGPMVDDVKRHLGK